MALRILIIPMRVSLHVNNAHMAIPCSLMVNVSNAAPILKHLAAVYVYQIFNASHVLPAMLLIKLCNV